MELPLEVGVVWADNSDHLQGTGSQPAPTPIETPVNLERHCCLRPFQRSDVTGQGAASGDSCEHRGLKATGRRAPRRCAEGSLVELGKMEPSEVAGRSAGMGCVCKSLVSAGSPGCGDTSQP